MSPEKECPDPNHHEMVLIQNVKERGEVQM